LVSRREQVRTHRRAWRQQPASAEADVGLIVAAIFDQITAALVRGARVELRGFGIFTVKQRNVLI
jgi:integration host factor subunit beta